MFAGTTTPLEVASAVGSISTPTVASFLPYVYVAAGLFVGYWIVKKILGLIPKHK